MILFFGGGFSLGGGRGRAWVGRGTQGRGSHGPRFLGRHISGATSGIREHLILWPVWHFTGTHGAQFGGPRAHGAQCGGTPSGGLSAIISFNKIRMKIFRIISTNYFWISMLNLKYQMYPTSKYSKASSYGVFGSCKKWCTSKSVHWLKSQKSMQNPCKIRVFARLFVKICVSQVFVDPKKRHTPRGLTVILFQRVFWSHF